MPSDSNNHCILSIGLHNGYTASEAFGWIHKLEEVKKTLKRELTTTFVTPPSLSFAHGLKYKEDQNEVRLSSMNFKVKNWIDENYPSTRFIDYARLSKNLVSPDGVHYGFNLNKVLLSIYFSGM